MSIDLERKQIIEKKRKKSIASTLSQRCVEVLPWHHALYQQHMAQFEKQRYAPIHLLSAPSFSGKRLFALSMMQSLLCQSRKNNEPCFTCTACQLFQAGTHPNAFMLSTDSTQKTIKIADIRELITKLQESNLYGSVRCILIDAMDDVLLAGSQALLKTLEEPPPNTYFFLLHKQLKSLLPTILSRCQLHELPKPTQAQAFTWLQNQTQLQQEAIEQALQFAQGLPLFSLALLNPDYSKSSRSKKNKSDTSTLIPIAWRNDFLEQWLSASQNPIQLAQQALQYDYAAILDALILMLRDIQLIFRDRQLTSHCRHVISERVLEQCIPNLTQKKIEEAYEQFIQLRKSEARSIHLNEKLQLERFFIDWFDNA